MKQLMTLLCAVFINVYALGQGAVNTTETASITTVQGAALNGRVYLKCTIKNQKEDGFLVFEILKDSIFQYLGSVAVNGVPVDLPMLYCFNYEDPDFKEAEFRVTCLTPGQTKITSPVFRVKKVASSFVASEPNIEEKSIDVLKNVE